MELRFKRARPLATAMGARSPIATTFAQSAILRPKLCERVRMMNDPRKYAPATLRNRDFILCILCDVLPDKGRHPRNRRRFRRARRSFCEKFPGSRLPTLRSRAGRVAECRGTRKGCSRRECVRAGGPGRLAITLADRFGRRDHSRQHGPYFILGCDARIDQGRGRDLSFGVRRSISTAHTNAKDLLRPRAIKHSTGALAIATLTGRRRDLEAVAAMAQSAVFSAPVIAEMPANNLSVVFHRI